MRFLAQICVAIFAGLGALVAAQADDLRSCSQAELNKAALAPMPKDYMSLNDYSSHMPHMAGYLVTIDAQGHPTVVCAIGQMTDAELMEAGANAVSKFVYWTEDATALGALDYVHITSQTYGLAIPSVLPRTTDPECDPSMEVGGPAGAVPIFKPKQFYQLKNLLNGKQATLTVVIRVKDTGAVQLFCQAAGSNISSFLETTYYWLAALRFQAQLGRPDFTYTVRESYKIRD